MLDKKQTLTKIKICLTVKKQTLTKIMSNSVKTYFKDINSLLCGANTVLTNFYSLIYDSTYTVNSRYLDFDCIE